MKFIKTMLLLAMVLAIGVTGIVACSSENKSENDKNQVISENVTGEKNQSIADKKEEIEIDKLIARKYGNEDSDIVIVYSQGGPMPEVEEDTLEEIRNSNDKLKDAYFVQPHQIQTEEPAKFMSEEIDFEDAINYDKKTVKNIADVVKHFKDNGKKVYVVGISFGAFVTTDLISEYGTEIADGYAIMVGRLNIDDVFWKGFSQGKNGYYENGVTPVITDAESVAESNMFKLAAGLGHKRYMDLLKNHDLSKVAYAYGKVDEQVGSLNEDEIKFLEDRGAKVFANEGGHYAGATDETKEMMEYILK